MNSRYGLKEVANVIFFDVATNKPVVFFDTLKVSTIENTSESAEARGGQGNAKLMSWDFGRTATLTMQDALLSDNSLSLLSGNTVKSTDVKVVGREVLEVIDGVVELAETPIAKSVTVYGLHKGVMQNEITFYTITGKSIQFDGTVDTDVREGDSEIADFDTITADLEPTPKEVMVFYEYIATTEAKQITFSADKFPATYRVVGDTVVRGEDGIDRKMQFVIPKAKLQTNFTLTMEAENVSTFDFTLEVLVDTSTKEKKLYDIIRVN